MQKQSWILRLFVAGFTLVLFLGATSVLASESVQISDILTEPSAYDGVEVEVTGILVAMGPGLLLEDDLGAQLFVHAGPLWYLVSPEGGELIFEVGEEITILGTVYTLVDSQDQLLVQLIASEIDGVALPQITAPMEGPHSAGMRGHCRKGNGGYGGNRGYGIHSDQDSSWDQRFSWMNSDAVGGICGSGSLTGLATYKFRR